MTYFWKNEAHIDFLFQEWKLPFKKTYIYLSKTPTPHSHPPKNKFIIKCIVSPLFK